MRAGFASRRGQLAGGVISTLSYTAQKFRYIFDDRHGCSLVDLYFVSGSLIALLQTIHPKFPIDADSLLMRFVVSMENRTYLSAANTFDLMAGFIAEAGDDKEKLVRAMLLVLSPLTAGTVSWSLES